VPSFKAQSWHLPGGTEGNREKIQNSLCPGRGLNRAPYEYKSKSLRPRPPSRFISVVCLFIPNYRRQIGLLHSLKSRKKWCNVSVIICTPCQML
jgi:hypothetical protein